MISETSRVALVTGADGVLGRRVARDLSRRGIGVIGMGRRTAPLAWPHPWISGDLVERGVLLAAARSADTIVHCATDPGSAVRDVDMVRELVEVCGTLALHLVHVSIVGIEDATASPYYAGKLEGERLLRSSGIPYALFRSTQFHPFVLSMLRRLEVPPLLFCPSVRLQPIDPFHVAEAIGQCVEKRAVGETTLCGPERLSMAKLADCWVRHRQVRRLRLRMPSLGPLAPMARLTPVDGTSGGLTWANWLQSGSADAERG